MSEIKQINVPNVVIPKFGTNEVWLNGVPFVPSNHPSVTTQIGFPIVEIPGCVKMHKDNQDKVTGLKILNSNGVAAAPAVATTAIATVVVV